MEILPMLLLPLRLLLLELLSLEMKTLFLRRRKKSESNEKLNKLR